MLSRIRSGVLSALIVLAGLSFLVSVVAVPAATYAILWLAAEIRALWYPRRGDFATFELDPFDAARLAISRETAADIVQRLSDIDAGRAKSPDPEAETDRLIEQYRQLRTQMAALRALPPRRLRKWSSARAMRSACRMGAICVPLIVAGAAAILPGNPLVGDPYRILSAACAGWIVLGLPLFFAIRRRQIEAKCGDREMFYERWRPEDDFLDFYLSRTDRSEPEEDGTKEADEPPQHPEVSPSPGGRQKRPWYVVLEVDPNAQDQDIRRAYHKRLMEYHPDKTASLGAEIRALAEVVTREITAAYEEAGRR